jgi:ElaB/YqjD/DUF883 family membrane-anchored ribosome-binding protein
MDDEPEVIRQQMDATRCSMSEKIERLEEAVTDKVQAVTSTVESVKQTFDIRRYYREYPWAAFGAAVAVGIAGDVMLRRRGGTGRIAEPPSQARPLVQPPTPSNNGGRERPPPAASRSTATAASMFGDEIGKLKGIALGAGLSLLRDWIAHSMPAPLRDQLAEVIDDATRKLGGEPIRGNLLDSFSGASGDGKTSRERDTINEARTARDRVAS